MSTFVYHKLYAHMPIPPGYENYSFFIQGPHVTRFVRKAIDVAVPTPPTNSNKKPMKKVKAMNVAPTPPQKKKPATNVKAKTVVSKKIAKKKR